MIRRVLLLSLFLPIAVSAQIAPSASPMPSCGVTSLAPLPSTVPVPEMIRPMPASARCINLLSYTERLRAPLAAPAPAPGLPVPAGAAIAPGSEAAYVPKTQFDNTPYRFNMTQNGKQMTADEFDAWMKAKGIRVARGAGAVPAGATVVPVGTALPAPPPAATNTAPSTGCVPSATVTC